jgi:hypothetical protein
MFNRWPGVLAYTGEGLAFGCDDVIEWCLASRECGQKKDEGGSFSSVISPGLIHCAVLVDILVFSKMNAK